MVIAVLAEDGVRNELLSRKFPPDVEFFWTASPVDLSRAAHADAYMDLRFEPDPERIDLLSGLLPKPVMVGAVIPTLSEIGRPFIRINAWPGFISGQVSEIALAAGQDPQRVKTFFDSIGWPCRMVSDTPGLVSPRIVSMIINEAYYTFEEQVSSKPEIDTAMKLGTNYPYGPFEWAEMIGIEKIHHLLSRLQEQDGMYSISEALKKEVTEKRRL
jgi:3-hydroxybutyryl-CoA dehydrogenase